MCVKMTSGHVSDVFQQSLHCPHLKYPYRHAHVKSGYPLQFPIYAFFPAIPTGVNSAVVDPTDEKTKVVAHVN